MPLTYVENVPTRVDTKDNSVEKSQIKVSFDGILSLGETRGGKTNMYFNWILYE